MLTVNQKKEKRVKSALWFTLVTHIPEYVKICSETDAIEKKASICQCSHFPIKINGRY